MILLLHLFLASQLISVQEGFVIFPSLLPGFGLPAAPGLLAAPPQGGASCTVACLNGVCKQTCCIEGKCTDTNNLAAQPILTPAPIEEKSSSPKPSTPTTPAPTPKPKPGNVITRPNSGNDYDYKYYSE
ncbi:uncharacterized protein LOC111714148 [Eurytemora carolleeae]|uniref:uncharacterized protein LOC111714148 n=1 Tax=Eurytemora carolleeae TaxID=1294199 RepID=UPI000C77B1CF|nr:uncharacterized protein LOC111714148 [Eurytemora carolleeae]|eukprot:XP_023344963.1 uncharacterized protein LOC111714148 [Eurytemora affinis]